jgi:catechol 2,3-dioxygenase-like lactoylglutathione lyase family enzyme
MNQHLANISILVSDYDEAIRYYTDTLGFELVEDTRLSEEKRWVLVRPRAEQPGCNLLLARAANPEQASRIGNQTGGRVFLFLHTDNFDRDYEKYRSKGVEFLRPPSLEAHGKVSVFKDIYGNLWDLIQPGYAAGKESV